MAQVDRSVRRRRGAAADAVAVSRGSLRRAVAGRLDRPAEAVADAAAPAAAVGRVLAGADAVAGVAAGSVLGASGCRPAARARAGIRFCWCWWPIGCWRRAASGGCIGSGSSAARWRICWARTSGWREIHKLYRCHDQLLAHKQALFDHLVGRWRDLFNASFDVLLYDLTSTYFEADPPFPRRRQAPPRLLPRPPQRLRAGGHRPGRDAGRASARPTRCCRATPPTTRRCADFLARSKRQYGKARRIWLMDRGIPTEEVLAEMRAADPPVHYLVGTPKGRLTRLEQDLLAQALAGRRGPGVQVKLLPQDGELYVLRPEPRSRRQGTRHAPAPAEMAVGAAQANRRP